MMQLDEYIIGAVCGKSARTVLKGAEVVTLQSTNYR